MSYIDDLRQRVETAEQGFGLITEKHGKYSERLIHLMNAVEESQRRKQAEIDRLAHENEQVRAMLHAILLAVEEGSRDRLSDAMRLLDARATQLVEPAAAVAVVAPAEPAADDPVADAPAEDTAAELPAEDIVASEPAEDIAAEGVAAEQPADDAVADEPVEDIAAEDVAAEQPADDAVADEPVENIAVEQVAEDIAVAPAAEDAVAGLSVEDVEAAPASSASQPAAPNAVAAIIQRISDKTRDMLEVEPPAEAPKPKTSARRSA